MTGISPEFRTAKPMRNAMLSLAVGFRPYSAERDLVLDHLQEMVDCGFASWSLNQHGGTELHLSSGEVFLLQDQGVLCVR
jgi:hypothetical protein